MSDLLCHLLKVSAKDISPNEHKAIT